MGSNYPTKITYNVDLVLCIDVTGSMDNILNIVKTNALNLYQDLITTMSKKQKQVDHLRVKVIAFRDYIADGKDAMLMTDFFELPDGAENLRICVNSLVAEGGGDDPEDGLEALAYAIKSEWDTKGMRKRHVIVVWTDASTHELGFGKKSEYYPNGMAVSMKELTRWWGDKQTPGYMNQMAKRLLLFAPNLPGWNYISDNWDNVIHCQSEAGKGLKEYDYHEIVATIASSI